MIVSTTASLEGYKIVRYIDVVSGHAIVGANAVSDAIAGFTGLLGGRSTTLEKKVRKAEEAALKEIVEEARDRGANAVIGLHVDFETIMLKDKDCMLAMAASGTAVVVAAVAEKNDDMGSNESVPHPTPTKSSWEKLDERVDPGRANRPTG